jgi:hypothetical protein
MFKVGNTDDVGVVEMQDIIFTTKGPTPGAVLVEWNIQATSQGSAALWGEKSTFFPKEYLTWTFRNTLANRCSNQIAMHASEAQQAHR